METVTQLKQENRKLLKQLKVLQPKELDNKADHTNNEELKVVFETLKEENQDL